MTDITILKKPCYNSKIHWDEVRKKERSVKDMPLKDTAESGEEIDD